MSYHYEDAANSHKNHIAPLGSMMLHSDYYFCKITGTFLSMWLDTKKSTHIQDMNPRLGSHSGQMELGYPRGHPILEECTTPWVHILTQCS